MPNYFTAETFKFFQELKENNRKEWFDEHKQIYDQHVYQAMKDFISLLSPAMHEIDPEFELRPYKAVSRIYRDTRFSRNKMPYKECMWLVFQKPASRDDWTNIPSYYLEINADTVSYGMGLFRPLKKTMDVFREEISYMQTELKEHIQKDVYDRGFSVNGEEYKRKIPNDLDEFFQPWIQRKGVYVAKQIPVTAQVLGPEFYKIIEEEFRALEWLYKFMKEVTEL